jgi:DNA-binding transcriptional MerR regulator
MRPAGVAPEARAWVPEAVSSGSDGAAAHGGVYGIGAVAAMLRVPQATLRSWEDRYGVVSPERTRGGHRLYSQRQIDELRFIIDEMARGASAADAHRALAQRPPGGRGYADHVKAETRVLILVAERDQYTAELIEFLLRTEGFGVEVTLDVDEAQRKFRLIEPDLVIVEFLLGDGDGEALCRWLRDQGASRVLVVSELDAADRALRAGADAFLRKPVGQLQLVSAVKDLLGMSAILGDQG